MLRVEIQSLELQKDAHLWNGLPHDALVLLFVDLLSLVIWFQRAFHLVHYALLPVQLLDVL